MTIPPSGGAADAGPRNLVLRIVSAAVLAPIVLAIAYWGGWIFLILCGLAAAGIFWEWTHLVAGRADLRLLTLGCAALLAALMLVALGYPAIAAVAIAIGAALAGAAAALGSAAGQRVGVLWAAGGVIYAGIAFLGPALLRNDAKFGFQAFLFVALIVWMTDILAYFVGRGIGGPRLWPQVSPNKTWSGALGGLAGGVAAAIAVAYASGIGRWVSVGVIALALSVLAQAGDLFESAVKRRFGAKDSGRIIPGHGGLMDRLDGFLFAAAAAALIGILHAGTGAAAQGLLLW
ncbi:MAG TPA: phosphatidate cytidylyltransferase [Xanthobacteraceae bacterium]|nr:phosphatidate cytidylyltransferase [Xanthobacteraceae bacterium]